MRKSISKKIRFEVFKRDKFMCQYCGESAPNVVLHIDHIHPVSKGGTNHILNLITSCNNCNQGKRDTLLSDDTIASKQKKQLEQIQERNNQIKMIADWHKEIVRSEITSLDVINELLGDLFNCRLSDRGEISMKKHIKSFGLKEVCEAIHISYNQYYDGSERSIANAMKKIGGICYNRYIERNR